MKHLLVTSFSPSGYEAYGKRFLETFVKHAPKDVALHVFHEASPPPEQDPRITYHDLLLDRDLAEFLERHKNNPYADGIVTLPDGSTQIDYRFQAKRFCRKIFALSSPLIPPSDWRIWVDADVDWTATPSFSDLLTDGDVYYLGRPKDVWHTSECGFVAYNLTGKYGQSFVNDFRSNYKNDYIFSLPEWHDSYLFDRLREAYVLQGCRFVDLAEGLKIMHPWPETALGKFSVHHKGPVAKAQAAAQPQPQPQQLPSLQPQHVSIAGLCKAAKNRYEQLELILDKLPHGKILEVGTHNGDRAVKLCSVNLAKGLPCTYYGFDVFEGGTPELNQAEMNAKGNPPEAEARGKLEALKQRYPSQFAFHLFKGLTSKTLNPANIPADLDFAFIDGGHAVDTIKGDYEAVKHAQLVVFDDYYLEGYDTAKFGCNEVVKGVPHAILPVIDGFPVMQDGKQVSVAKIGMAAVGAVITPAGQRPSNSSEVKIKTRNCVPDEIIQANVRLAAGYKDYFRFMPQLLRPNQDKLLIVGGSPSVLDSTHPSYNSNWTTIRERVKQGYKVVAVKTSYDKLVGAKLIPTYCILLDPRDHVAAAIQQPKKQTVYFISSMCDRSTWAKFTKLGARVFGYHAGVGAGEVPIIHDLWGKAAPIVHGGTTAGFRGISLLVGAGFRTFALVGFDSSYHEKPAKVHGRSPKQPVEVNIALPDGSGKQTFWTDPELIAQSQDLEMMLKTYYDLDVEVIGDGMLSAGFAMIRRVIADNPADKKIINVPLQTWVNVFNAGDDRAEYLHLEHIIAALSARRQALEKQVAELPTLAELT